MHKLETHLLLSVGSGDAEHEFARLVVEYTYHKGSPAYTPRGEYAPIDPPEPEHCTLGRVFVVVDGYHNPLPEWMVEPLTEQLERLCLADWHGANDYAREQAAEMRREDLMLERRPLVAE